MQLCSQPLACTQELLEVPVEVAALVRRRTLGTVEVPAALAAAVENAAQSGTRSSKLQRKQTLQLVESLRQLSRTPGKGGASMTLIDANSGSQQKRRRRVWCHQSALIYPLCHCEGDLKQPEFHAGALPKAGFEGSETWISAQLDTRKDRKGRNCRA